jgi:hypothetical protein
MAPHPPSWSQRAIAIWAAAVGASPAGCGAGSFLEALVVDASRDGLRVYGGLDCGTWSYAATEALTVAPRKAATRWRSKASRAAMKTRRMTL